MGSPDSATSSWWARVPAGAAGVLVLLAWAVGHLSDPGLWLDEVYSALFATQPLGTLVETLWSSEANMAPYYLALHFWVMVSTSEAWLRLPSVIGAAVTVLALSGLVRRWTQAYPLAVASGIVLALIPAFRTMAVDARGYAWGCAAVTLAALAIGRAADGTPQLRVLPHGLLMGLAVSLNLVAVLAFVIPAALTVWAANRKAWLTSLAGSTGIALVVFAPFARAYWVNQGEQVAWIPDRSMVGYVAETWGDGLWLTAVFMAAASGALVLAALPSLGARATDDADARGQRVFLTMAAVGTALPPVLLVAVSELVQPLYVSRYLSFTLPFAVAATVGTVYFAVPRLATSRGPLLASLASVVAAVALLSLWVMPWSSERRSIDDFRGASQHLASTAESADVILFEDFVVNGFAWYGLPEGVRTYGDPGSPTLIDVRGLLPLDAFDPAPDQVVWWVSRSDGTNPPANLDDAHAALSDCRPVTEHQFGLVVLQRYGPGDSCSEM